VPSSAMVAAPVQARTPPTSHISKAAPGEGELVSMAPGEVKMPLPMTMLMTMAKASSAPRVGLKVRPLPPMVAVCGLVVAVSLLAVPA